MIKKICLLECRNQYDSKRYFTRKFAQALKRTGIDPIVFSWTSGPVPPFIIRQIQDIQPDLTCSFHQLPKQPDGRYFWDALKIPHWSILLDPAFYDLELIASTYSIISCVDRFDCGLLASYQFKHGFFFPHAVEKELIAPVHLDDNRPYDVIMLGTCYDPENLYTYWKRTYSDEIVNVLEEAVEIVLSNGRTNFFQALMQSLALNGVSPREVEFDKLAYLVDFYSRGIDRLLLVRSIKDVPVHVFGGKCWRDIQPIEGWQHYFSDQSNVIVHPAVDYPEALELLKQSKICLNSMPFFKDGSHERIFASLASGALPVTSDSLYIHDHFIDNEDLLFYKTSVLEELNDRIVEILKTPHRLIAMIEKGQEKIRTGHTWDERVQTMLKELPALLNSINS